MVIINLLFIGTFGAVSTSFVELRDINIELDDSISTEYEVKVLDKRISKGSEFTSYYLYLNDWNNEVTRKEVEVSNGIYHSAFIGDHLIIKQKDGYLNYRWVEGLEKK